MVFLISFLAFILQLAAANPAVCSTGSAACMPKTTDGEILLHTRSQLTVSDGISEKQESHAVTAAFELDHLGVAILRREGRDASLSLAEQSSKAAQQAAWVSFKGTLGKVLSNLEISRQAANKDLSGTIDKFIAAQAGSEDACHAQLLETKQQLNQLHLHVNDLSAQINATDHEVTALNAQVESKIEEAKRLEEKCKQELEELEKQQGEDLKFLELLRGELEEMIQIANPDVTMNQTGRKVFAGGEKVESLLADKLQTETLWPFLKQIRVPSSTLMLSHKTHLASFIQMHVQDDGKPTKVMGHHDVFAALKGAMKTASHCIVGKERFSLAGIKQTPLDGEDSNEDNEYYDGQYVKPTGVGADIEQGPGASEMPGNSDLTLEVNDDSLSVGPTMPPAQNVHCAKTDVAKVDVGGTLTALSPPRDLAKGEFAQVPCVKVNKEYFGVIWLSCEETLQASASQCLKAANATKCQEELEILQKVYVKTYVDLARLIQSYEEKTTDGYEAAKTAIEDQCRDRREPLQEEASKIAAQASEKIKELEELRPKLEDASDAYQKLAAQVKKLTSQCKSLPETLSDLDKVRDTIKALSLCPGLQQTKLDVPSWIKMYTKFETPAAGLSDSDYDALMRETCEKAYGSKYPDKILRAASVAEMEAHAILDLPLVNEAETPLIGPCPGCEGDEDAGAKSGHLRVCWKPGANLTVGERSTQCNEGLKSIACVIVCDK
jgi:prefoldin subunit 5